MKLYIMNYFNTDYIIVFYRLVEKVTSTFKFRITENIYSLGIVVSGEPG